MMIIEIINIQSRGRWKKSLRNNGFLQIVIAAFMGIMPGCLGSFAIVSLYVHGTINFAALVAAMIATSGDEIFIMFAMIPKNAMIIVISLFFIAISAGILVNIFYKKKFKYNRQISHKEFHTDSNDCLCFSLNEIKKHYRNFSFHRALLIFGFISFTILMITSSLVENEWDWENITFLITGIVGLAIVTTVSEHFLMQHLWLHIIKQHFLKIFLWTFGAFLVIHLLDQYIDVEKWTQSNQYLLLIIAVLIGLIPESGPHIVFISLFASGNIPFSILLANSIVQDGHGAIPLLAETRKDFIAMKLINALVGLIVGAALMAF